MILKKHNYDAYEIIKEYSKHLSLGEQIITKETTGKILAEKEKSINEGTPPLEYKLNSLNQIMDTYYKLDAIGFGIRELKQLKSLIVKINLSNDIPYYESVPKFIKDVEEQYDCKLGFEKKIDELKTEFGKIKIEIRNYMIYKLNLILVRYYIDFFNRV